MRGYKCHICGGMCDPGELENGVCFDCRREAVEHSEEFRLSVRKSINQMLQERRQLQSRGK